MSSPTTVADREAAMASFSTAFKGAMAAVRRLRGRETHRPGELSYAQYGLLFGLSERGTLPASELAAVADLAPGTASQMLDALAAHGLIERMRSERDRRIVLVSLTERGSEIVAGRRARYEPLWRVAFADFSDEELRTAAAVLQRAGGLFERMVDEGTCEE